MLTLISVEIITEKKIIKRKSNSSFTGKLFYAIVLDKASNSVTFYYSRVNTTIGKSVTRGLPLFIRDFFKLEPTLFCSSDFLIDALVVSWD